MPFQFGTNWSRYSDAVADIVAPLLGYEGLTAFFLEAGFLGVLLFGRKLLPPWAHFFSALMVALGTLASTFWILSNNSWMQTPTGYDLVDGRFVPRDWLEIIFNPSFPYRLAHVVTAVYITTGFVVAGVACLWLLRRIFYDEARVMLSMTLWLLTVLVPLQAVIGDQHGLDTLKYQPAKIAGIEAIWEGGRRLPWVVFAIPDDAAAKNLYEIAIPDLGSLILTHDIDGEVRGLKSFAPEDRPPVAPPFFGFRIMLACWGLMMLTVALSLWLRLRGQLYEADWYHRLCLFAAPLGFVAVIAGWVTTEVGRQPWTVYGHLRTADSVTPSLTGLDVTISFLGYVVVYIVMFSAGIAMMLRVFAKGPIAADMPDFIASGRPQTPVEALPHARSEP
jgi:cytochrome d ubiquinol oxidase subunit I